MSDTSLQDIGVEYRQGYGGITLRMWNQTNKVWIVKSLTADQANTLAASIIGVNVLSGSGGVPLIARLSNFHERITGLFDELGDFIAKADQASACGVCGRVIHNKANMARHAATHGTEGEKVDGDE